MKILLVDDIPEIREIIKKVINRKDTSFIECDSGFLAIAKYKQHKPDLVLMDLKMKEINGFEASKLILDEFPDAKIYIVTNYNDSDLRNEAKEIGILRYITKDNLMSLGEYI